MIDISVIVPVYNVEKYLPRFFDSIMSQIHKNYEVILINDGSTDNSGELCDEYADIDNRLKVLHQKNQGTGAARNSGLDIAKGKYIYFCDPDDYLEPTLLKDNFLLAERYQTNLLIFGYYHEVFDNSDQKKVILKKLNSMFLETKENFRNNFRELYKTNMMYTLWNKLYRRRYLDSNNCRFGSEKVGQDTVFNYKVYKNLNRVLVNDKLYYHYVAGRADSAVNSYRKDRFKIRYNETLKFEMLIESWGYYEKYKNLVVNDWLRTLTIGINNLLSKNCPLNKKEKKKEIINYINSPKIRDMFDGISLDNYSNVTKIKIVLLKNKKIVPYILFYKFKNIARNIKN